MVLDRAELSLRLARILAPVTVLGPGRRAGIWTQGCAIGCVGCASLDTWDPDGGQTMSVDHAVTLLLDKIVTLGLDGLAITGGEPTDQGDALAALIDQVRAARSPQPVDVICFTGRSLAAARVRAPGLLARADCVVSGPYRPHRPAANRLVASDNQQLTFTGREAEDRYRHWLSHDAPRLQVTADDADLYLVGLPGPGDLDRFADRLQDRGVSLGGVSWRA